METSTFEIFLHGQWRKAAELSPKEPELGHEGGCLLAYLPEYVAQHLDRPAAVLSCRFPVNYLAYNSVAQRDRHMYHDTEDRPEFGWPAFLLDLIPQGFGRRELADRLGLSMGPASDWPLLIAGGGNPIGNVRVAEAARKLAENRTAHPGFGLEQILERQEEFIAYARDNGILLPGSSGVQGDAPKMLLVEGKNGRWYADGSLPEEEVKRHYLIKMRRGKTAQDAMVLANEAPYMEVAALLGLRANQGLRLRDRILFIPRFDRGKGEILGQESLFSLAGINQLNAAVRQIEFCRALARYSSFPQEDITEFVLRDILNLILGNTDNHGRNNAVLRFPDGTVRLSPLFDFAPMYLDPEGVARRYRWQCEHDRGLDWREVLHELGSVEEFDTAKLAAAIVVFAKKLAGLEQIMAAAGVDESIIKTRTRSLQRDLDLLNEVSPWTNEKRTRPERP